MSRFSAFYSRQQVLHALNLPLVKKPVAQAIAGLDAPARHLLLPWLGLILPCLPLVAFAQNKPKPQEDKNAPVILEAEQITGRPERHLRLLRRAEMVRDKTRVCADQVEFDQVEDELKAQGGVKMQRFDDIYTGEQLQLRLDSGRGYILQPTYQIELPRGRAQGQADRVDFVAEDQSNIVNGTYSTCEGSDPDWYLKADVLNLDFGRDVGSAGKTLVYFKNVPILGTPALSFPLSGARRTGLLPPTVGATSTGGFEFTQPYYWNIAPNRDMTFFPKIISRRGIQLGVNARYLGQTYRGETNLEILPHDRKAGRSRYSLSTISTHQLTDNMSMGWNASKASDDNYPTDFASSMATNTQRQLLREMRVDYQGSFWNASLRAQSFQILQDPAAKTRPELTVFRPYDRLPEANFNAMRRDLAGFDLSLDAQLTRFWHPDLERGQRLVLHPQISYPILHPAYFLTPKIGVHMSRYQMDKRLAPNLPLSPERTVPTFSLDGGMVFERSTSLFGKQVTQTLEPRLFYVNTPYRDQSKLPVFDSAEAGFSFAQLFSENRFTGHDRISDANQITAALVSRYLSSDGAEMLRLAMGQRFYFRNQKVSLDPKAAEIRDSRSDILLAASGSISPHWSFDSSLQYSVSKHQMYAANYGVQWQPRPKHVLNAEYRYQRAESELLNLSGQWPLTNRYYAVGHISYSLPEHQTVKSLAGFEYNADCWVLRFAAQRFSTSGSGATTTLFLQLELNGLSRLGPNPLDALSKNIPGYQKVNKND